MRKQGLLPAHREIFYTVHYEIPNVTPHGWWPVSRGDMKDPSLKSIRDDIEYLIRRDSSYDFDRKTAFEKLRELRGNTGLVRLEVRKYRYYATGMLGPDGKPMRMGQSKMIHLVRFPLTNEVTHG